MNKVVLNSCNSKIIRWLSVFSSRIICTGILPKAFKRTKVAALLKPGKPADKPESYRTIALLSVCYKLLERELYNRISQTTFEHISIEHDYA